MSLPTITGVGRLTADPELRFAPSGVAVCKLRLAFNNRRKNERGEWEDGDVCYLDGTLFKQAAENAAESLARGVEIVVTGRLKTRQWEDRETGGKRSATELLIDSIGPSIAFATAKVQKMARTSGGGSSSGGRPAPDSDPWAASAVGVPTDEPPF